MHFFPGRHIAGAHCAVFFFPAFSNTYASQRCVGETRVIVRISEMSLGFRMIEVGAQAKVLVETVWSDDLSGIHLPIGVPDSLELPECRHQFWTKHFRQQLGSRLSVSML